MAKFDQPGNQSLLIFIPAVRAECEGLLSKAIAQGDKSEFTGQIVGARLAGTFVTKTASLSDYQEQRYPE